MYGFYVFPKLGKLAFIYCIYKVKGKSYRPMGPMLRLPDTVTSALEGIKLLALRTGRLYPQEYPGNHF
jgi:hypothetical protein